MKLFKKLIRSLYKRLWKDEWKELNKIKYFKNSYYETEPKQWIDYAQSHNMEEKFDTLKRGLGKDDIEEINLLRQRIKLQTGCFEKGDLYYINLDEIYTEEEKRKKKSVINI